MSSPFQLDKVYDADNAEDDMNERYEEMSRMREHVLKEWDKNGDKLIDLEEFIAANKSGSFNNDSEWKVHKLVSANVEGFSSLLSLLSGLRFLFWVDVESVQRI